MPCGSLYPKHRDPAIDGQSDKGVSPDVGMNLLRVQPYPLSLPPDQSYHCSCGGRLIRGWKILNSILLSRLTVGTTKLNRPMPNRKRFDAYVHHGTIVTWGWAVAQPLATRILYGRRKRKGPQKLLLWLRMRLLSVTVSLATILHDQLRLPSLDTFIWRPFIRICPATQAGTDRLPSLLSCEIRTCRDFSRRSGH